MTLLARLLSLFPLSCAVFMLLSLRRIILDPSALNFSLFLASCYLYPLLAFRLHNLFFPLKEGAFNLAQKKYSPWWGSFKIQEIYYQIPQLEYLLHLIPGLYSFWLRLWGSKIGKGVIWTPNVEVNDRGLMRIGDGVVTGHKCHFICHVIWPKKDGLLLIVKRITLDSHAFIGAGSKFGPGVIVEERVCIPALTQGLPKQHFRKDKET